MYEATIQFDNLDDRDEIVAALRAVAEQKRMVAGVRAGELRRFRRAGVRVGSEPSKLADYLADAQLLADVADMILDARALPPPDAVTDEQVAADLAGEAPPQPQG